MITTPTSLQAAGHEASGEKITLVVDLRGLALAAERAFGEPADFGSIVSRDAIPCLVVTPAELVAQPLDHRAGFVVSFVDGRWTVGSIVDMAGIGEVERIWTLRTLLRLGILELRAPAAWRSPRVRVPPSDRSR